MGDFQVPMVRRRRSSSSTLDGLDAELDRLGVEVDAMDTSQGAAAAAAALPPL